MLTSINIEYQRIGYPVFRRLPMMLTHLTRKASDDIPRLFYVNIMSTWLQSGLNFQEKWGSLFLVISNLPPLNLLHFSRLSIPVPVWSQPRPTSELVSLYTFSSLQRTMRLPCDNKVRIRSDFYTLYAYTFDVRLTGCNDPRIRETIIAYSRM
jgi:hypothetical protein